MTALFQPILPKLQPVLRHRLSANKTSRAAGLGLAARLAAVGALSALTACTAAVRATGNLDPVGQANGFVVGYGPSTQICSAFNTDIGLDLIQTRATPDALTILSRPAVSTTITLILGEEEVPTTTLSPITIDNQAYARAIYTDASLFWNAFGQADTLVIARSGLDPIELPLTDRITLLQLMGSCLQPGGA